MVRFLLVSTAASTDELFSSGTDLSRFYTSMSIKYCYITLNRFTHIEIVTFSLSQNSTAQCHPKCLSVNYPSSHFISYRNTGRLLNAFNHDKIITSVEVHLFSSIMAFLHSFPRIWTRILLAPKSDLKC